MDRYHTLIRRLYRSSSGDSTDLFQAILSAADEIGLDQALACLEQCVCAKRLPWLDARRWGSVSSLAERNA